MHDYFNFDSFLRELKDVIDVEVLKKVEQANSLHKLQSNHIKIYKQSNNLKYKTNRHLPQTTRPVSHRDQNLSQTPLLRCDDGK